MATIHENGDRIALAMLDIRILTTLLAEPLSSYHIARQCEEDAGAHSKISNGSILPAINKLVRLHLVRDHGTTIGKVRKTYEITSLGRQVLEWELKSLDNLQNLARKRN